MLVASLFAGSTAFAVYNEMVARVAWEKQQVAFVALDFGLAKEAALRARGLVSSGAPPSSPALEGAETWLRAAEAKAHPPASLVGPFQIQQVAVTWMDPERDVDRLAFDRCQTCHQGALSVRYESSAIARQFRTHPSLSTLLRAHPVATFGCTACHQGQGRATDDRAHSTIRFREGDGRPAWRSSGDPAWEEPLLQVGELHAVVIDQRNDTLEVKLGRGRWQAIVLEHRGEAPGGGIPEADLLAEIQGKLQTLVDEDPAVAGFWRAVARSVDHRVRLGLEPTDPRASLAAKDVPAVRLRFPKREVAAMLGFAGETIGARPGPLQVAKVPPSVPVRSEAMETWDEASRYHPPRGDRGLQIPDGMRDRFIQGLPEVESGCVKCHAGDVDLRPRVSVARYIEKKLDRERAEAHRAHDPEGYRRADTLPDPGIDPAELIDLAPTLSEGRAIFRKLNCVGCHVLEGVLQERKAGPAILDLTAKVSPEWLLRWLRNPRGLRAKTSMPNFWPRPLDPVSKRPMAEGTPAFAAWQEQRKLETVAIASSLVERSERPASRPEARPLKDRGAGWSEVEGATPEKGKVLFEGYGCQGCHARSDGDTASEKLPAAWRDRERDIAPTLAGMADKTTADWIAFWVFDPKQYSPGTRMPSLRLTREEAASIGKYVVTLASSPLDPAEVDPGEASLVADPEKRRERVPCARAGGALLSRVECGDRLLGTYGCYGCHVITGFERSAPIGPELSGFARKDVSSFDFASAVRDHHLHTTETFATLKLDSPRIFGGPNVDLKMGDFDLSPREIRALVVFLKGQVEARPSVAYAPASHPEYAAVMHGRQLAVDLNCRGCHVLEGTGSDLDGFRQPQLAVDPQARAPSLDGEGMRVQPEWLVRFLRDPGKNGVRPFLHPEWVHGSAVPPNPLAPRMPSFSLTQDQQTALVRAFARWDAAPFPYEVPEVNRLSESERRYALAHMISTADGNCLSCHFQGEFPEGRGRSELAKLAPDLNAVARRLRPEWVKAWLLRPQNFQPDTKMTAFWATTDRPKDSTLWPSEGDPFLSEVPRWTKAKAPEGITSERQVEIVRDFLFSLPPDAVFPKAGEEAGSPLVVDAPPNRPLGTHRRK